MAKPLPDKAAEIFQVLKGAAKAQKTLTYGELGVRTNLSASGLTQYLAAIQGWCEEWRMLHLNALVVAKDTGLPGASYRPSADLTLETFQRLQQQIYAFKWDSVRFS